MLSFDATFGDFRFKYFKRAQWMLIFHHEITGRVYFDNDEEALNCHEEKKYSILSSIKDTMKFNDKFEFLLQYGSSQTKYNRWKQKLNPLEQTEEDVKEAEGFESIHLDYNTTLRQFKGLAKTTIPCYYEENPNYIPCLINGYFDHANWFFAIGEYRSYDSNWVESIPGVKGEPSVDLWIRILPDYNQIYQSIFNKHNFFNLHINLFISILL